MTRISRSVLNGLQLAPRFRCFSDQFAEHEFGFAWLARVHPDDAERTLEQLDGAFSAGEATRVEFRLRRHDGINRRFPDFGLAFYRDGEFAGFIGSCFDVTDWPRAEAFLSRVSQVLEGSE